jgi:hypothetical protein
MSLWDGRSRPDTGRGIPVGIEVDCAPNWSGDRAVTDTAGETEDASFTESRMRTTVERTARRRRAGRVAVRGATPESAGARGVAGDGR